MDEVGGLPTEIVGFQSADLDDAVLRLEQIIDSGLEPRIRRHLRVIACGADRSGLILRIERSWSGPHRVIFKESDRFWGRNSAGKYSLDVNELRGAFNLSSTVTERIRGFRTDRAIAISNDETPVLLRRGPKVVMHCIPFESFAGQQHFDVVALHRTKKFLPAMGDVSTSSRFNLDGLLVTDYFDGNACQTYTQLHRNGLIEVVSTDRCLIEDGTKKWISPWIYERRLPDYLSACLGLLQEIGANVPIVVALTLTNVRGLPMYDQRSFAMVRYPIDRDTLVLPEGIVEQFSDSPNKLLIPMFDLVWNACGYPKSKNFDDEGNWTGKG